MEYSIRSTKKFSCNCGKISRLSIDPRNYSRLLIQGEVNRFKIKCTVKGCKKTFKNRHEMKKHKIEEHSY